jgi:hypothetical protein
MVKPVRYEHPLLLRARFKDDEIENHMTKEVAEICGYKRVIDVNRTLDLNRHNIVIEQYAKSELREDPNVFQSITSLLGNFLFLMRVIIFQIIIAGLPHSP